MESQITGVCTEIAQKPGSEWVEFHVDGGGKYPVRLSTKLQPLIELGRAVGQQLATWTYTETDGNPNPHKPGEFYKNRYLESVEIGGTTVPQPQDAPKASSTPRPTQPAPGHPPLIAGDKDRAITRMAVLRTTVHLYQGAAGLDDVSNDLLVIKIMDTARRFERWVYRDIQDEPFE